MKLEVINSNQNRIEIRSILVIDDHPLYCDALASTLEQIFHAKTVKKANSLTEGLKLATARFSPDLVILDLNLPDVSGLSGFLRLKDKMPDVPVLVISAESSNEIIQSLIYAGAAGFVPKEASHTVLHQALEDVSNGRRFLPPGYNKTAQPSRREMTRHEIAQKISELTPQQSRIIRLICAGKPNKLIAYEMSLAEATVKAHITALLRKLGVQNRTQAAVLVRSVRLDGATSMFDAEASSLLN